MNEPASGFDRVQLKRVAFGIRFSNQFGLEDALGAVVDEILASPSFGPERFETTLYTPESRQLMSANNQETIELTRADAIFQTTKGHDSHDLLKLAEEFAATVWGAVCKRAPRIPSIIRYGSLVSFPLPENWNPIQSILGAEPTETSEFDLRYVRRLLAEGALAKQDVNDFRNAIFLIQTRRSKTSALIDFQHVFEPALNSEKARKDQPFVRFVEKALAYYRVAGWEFLKSRIERLSRAA
jgi:hypothetical protein